MPFIAVVAATEPCGHSADLELPASGKIRICSRNCEYSWPRAGWFYLKFALRLKLLENEFMKANPILEEVWRIKDQLAAEAGYDI